MRNYQDAHIELIDMVLKGETKHTTTNKTVFKYNDDYAETATFYNKITDIASEECIKLLKSYELQKNIINKSTIDNFIKTFNELNQVHDLEAITHEQHIKYLDYNVSALCESCVFRDIYHNTMGCKASSKSCREFRRKLNKLCDRNDKNMYYIWFTEKG